MDGTVTSFLPTKGYGFARGDDGRDYFLHQSDVQSSATVIEGQRISFDESATPKGYRARHVRAITTAGPVRYALPDEILLINGADAPGGWELLDTCAWTITGSARGAPDDARRLLKRRAQQLGATGVIGVRYSKSTGSEGATGGKGTHGAPLYGTPGVSRKG